MSYDVYLDIDAGGPEPVTLSILEANMTWNLRPMFAEVNNGDGPQEWDGKLARDVAEILVKTLDAFNREPAKFRAMNPANGWGDFDGARQFAMTVLDACHAAPNATVRVC
ncbi:hypothetical protein [Caulobacter sp. UC70_42]|uniref:hypothetical protein n=1 Tax=Caulobacter sp. UC70_42 TaxID=3374551 RepID=UPI0037578BE5